MPDITQQSMHWLEWHNCDGYSQSVQWHNPHKDYVWKPRQPYDSCVWQRANSAGVSLEYWAAAMHSEHTDLQLLLISRQPKKIKNKKLWFHGNCMKSLQTIINKVGAFGFMYRWKVGIKWTTYNSFFKSQHDFFSPKSDMCEEADRSFLQKVNLPLCQDAD